MFADETISAIATPIGEGGISVVRVSGRLALRIAARIFVGSSDIPVEAYPTHTAHHGAIVDPQSGERLDDGVLTVFRAPRSYTGEDSVEISCHGGLVPTRRVLEAALRAGARIAEPGEFTKRAFLNGRLDLAQAEAVLDIIRARTDESLRVARRQMEGALSSQIRALREDLLGIMARIEAAIDFPDDVEDIPPEEVAPALHDAISHVAGLLDTASCGKVYREGVQAVIVGRPNVGKSSLLNALVRESRAIVTPVPGTTRDVIEETVSIRGIPVRAVDTAGIRPTSGVVERAGIERTHRMIEQADLVIAMLDASKGLTRADKDLLRALSPSPVSQAAPPPGPSRLLIVVNKTDLLRCDDAEALLGEVRGWAGKNVPGGPPVIGTAAPSNEGIAGLEDLIAEAVMSGGVACAEGAVVSNVRHSRALEEARLSLQHCLRTVEAALPMDFVSIDLRAAVDSLGKITGETATEDVIDRIFADFCIGK